MNDRRLLQTFYLFIMHSKSIKLIKMLLINLPINQENNTHEKPTPDEMIKRNGNAFHCEKWKANEIENWMEM